MSTGGLQSRGLRSQIGRTGVLRSQIGRTGVLRSQIFGIFGIGDALKRLLVGYRLATPRRATAERFCYTLDRSCFNTAAHRPG